MARRSTDAIPPSSTPAAPDGLTAMENDVVGTVRVVLAPNAFKGTLTAREAAAAMAAGVREAMPDAECVLRPIADGGDGTVDAVVAVGYRPVLVEVRNALGRRHTTAIAMRDGHAVVELAGACGLAALGAQRDPMRATTIGLGDSIRAALDHGAERISIGLGGSASTDGGGGMLTALGALLLDEDGQEVAAGGDGLSRVSRLDLTGLDPRLAPCSVDVLADVTSPLHGPRGAAHMFAVQKGASHEQVEALDAGLRRWGRVLADATGRRVEDHPGAGAAGGTGAAALAALDAEVLPGAATIADLLGLSDAIAGADLVITGEGRLDGSTLVGKGSAEVIARAREVGTPVAAVCGAIELEAAAVEGLGLAAAIAAPGSPADAPAAVRSAVARIALELAGAPG